MLGEFRLRISSCELCSKNKLRHIRVQLLRYIKPCAIRLGELPFRAVKEYHSHTFQPVMLRESPLITSGLHLPVALRYKTHHIRYTFEIPVQHISLKCHLVHIISRYNAPAICGNIVQETWHGHDTPRVYPVIRISVIYNI